MAVPGPQGTHRRVDAAVEVLDLVGGVLGVAPADPDAEQRLGADQSAELDELLQSRPGRLEPSPGPERPAQVGVADRVPPLELAKVGVIERAPAEPDDPRLACARTAATTSGRQPPTAFSGMSDALSSQSVPGPRNSIVSVAFASVSRRNEPGVILLPVV